MTAIWFWSQGLALTTTTRLVGRYVHEEENKGGENKGIVARSNWFKHIYSYLIEEQLKMERYFQTGSREEEIEREGGQPAATTAPV